MTTKQLKVKFPESIEMIDNLTRECKLHEIRGNRTVHDNEDGKYYYNYEGLHIRLFPSLEMLIEWFFGNRELAETTIKEFSYSAYLSKLKSEEVWLDEDNNVSDEFCDFTNEDFTPEELQKANLHL